MHAFANVAPMSLKTRPRLAGYLCNSITFVFPSLRQLISWL
jgi:hypothetical protein